MRIGLVAEGPSDIAVLRNILYGALGLERADTVAIRPELFEDETDRAARRTGHQSTTREEEYSNWGLVLEECRRRERIADWLDSPLDEERLVIVQLDTAECELPRYDVKRPDRSAPDYPAELRARVEARLRALVGDALAPRVRYAIAIEETDAWVLAGLGVEGAEILRDPKRALWAKDAWRRLQGRTEPAKYEEISKPLRKSKGLRTASRHSVSLRLFLGSLPQHPADGMPGSARP